MARQRLEVVLDETDVQALRQVDKKSSDWRARERARTLLLLGQGKSLAEVAQLQDITTRTVCNTWARWCAQGMASLVDKPRCGAPRKLDDTALERLTQWASEEPLTAVELKLPCFGGHLIVHREGVRDAYTQAAVPGAIPSTNRRTGAGWAQAQRAGQRVWLPRHHHPELGAPCGPGQYVSFRHASSGCALERR